MPEPESLFEPVEGGWVPTDYSRGPWTPDALQGGPVAALLAGVADRRGSQDNEIAWLPARLTIELLRPVPVEPLRVDASMYRPGRKVQLVDATLRTAGGTDVATARLLRVREEAIPAPVTTGDQVPPTNPETLTGTPTLGRQDYAAFHSHGVEHRFAVGTFDELGPASDWIRLRVPVVPDEAPTPLQRVAAAADFGNGVSRVADFTELTFINPDLTIHLHRPPAGEWVCIEAQTWMEERGLALAESRLWDTRGPLGRSLQSLLIDRRPS